MNECSVFHCVLRRHANNFGGFIFFGGGVYCNFFCNGCRQIVNNLFVLQWLTCIVHFHSTLTIMCIFSGGTSPFLFLFFSKNEKRCTKRCTSVKIKCSGQNRCSVRCDVSETCTFLAGDETSVLHSFSCATLACMSFTKTIGGVRVGCFFCIFNTIIVNIGYIFVQMYYVYASTSSLYEAGYQ